MCYLSVDQLKRGLDPATLRDTGEGPVLVVHAGVPWSLGHGANTAKPDEPDGLRGDVQVSDDFFV